MGSTTPDVGKLEPVDLKEVWSHEAQSFTPWLLANSDRLSEALGLNLELHAAEHPVGSFRLDLIGMDSDTGRRVIVENQLEQTDHKHLGQILTYTGGTDPAVIVWVAKRFQEEHISALNWLNDHTDEEIGFYGVQVSAVRIGNSNPAALFDVVARPNNWQKFVKTSASTLVRGGAEERHIDFWNQLQDQLELRKISWKSLMRKNENTKSWMTFSSGTTSAWYAMSFAGPIGTREIHQSIKCLRSEIYFGSTNPDLNTNRFESLNSRRETIEESYGEKLSFEALPDKKACRISAYTPGESANLEKWDEYIDWLIRSQTRLRSAIESAGGIL